MLALLYFNEYIFMTTQILTSGKFQHAEYIAMSIQNSDSVDIQAHTMGLLILRR